MSAFGLPPLVPTLYEWEVVLPPDVTPPDTTITRGPPPATASFVNWLEMTGTDDQTAELEMEFECRVDNGPWESCDAPEEIEVLTRGQHRVEVRAVDETGNVDPTPAFRNFTVIDISAPDTSIDSGPNSETGATSATFTYSGEEETGEAVFEFECALDDGEYVDCSDQPYTVTGLSGGPHVMYVRARDPDGNVDPTPDFYEWLVTAPVDTTPPDTVIFFGPAEGSVSGPDADVQLPRRRAGGGVRVLARQPAVRGLRGAVRADRAGDRLAHAARARARPGRPAERGSEPGGPQLDGAGRAPDADRLDAAGSQHQRERRVHVLVRPDRGRRRHVPVLGRRLGVDAVQLAVHRRPAARPTRAARSTSSRCAR